MVAYVGLAPGQRESAGKRKNLSIEKTGSPLLRWVLVQAAWQLVSRSPKWGQIHTRLEGRIGRKKAIIAITRRLLCVAHALLNKQEDYREFRAADVMTPQVKQQLRRERSRSQQEISM